MIAEQLAEQLTTELRIVFEEALGESLRVVTNRAGPSGDVFKAPTGFTATSIDVVNVDLTGPVFTASFEAKSDGAFFTNLGKVLTPTSPGVKALRWFNSVGEPVFARSVDMTPYKDWLHRLVDEEYTAAVGA